MNRLVFCTVIILILTVIGGFLGIVLGPSKLPLGDLLNTLLLKSDSVNSTIIWDIRIPRILIAFTVGSAFAISGVILQTNTRNPLGDPQLFGITGGALIVQALVLSGILSNNPWFQTTFSVIASIISAILIFTLANRSNVKPSTLALIGFSIGAMCIAISTGIMAYYRVFTQQVLSVIGGSTSNIPWSSYFPMLPFMLLGLILIFAVSNKLNVIVLGDVISKNIGINSTRIKFISMISAGILSGAAVSVVGTVGLLGLMAPHITRIIVGNNVRLILCFSIPIGGLLMLYADQISRLAFMPNEVPVGFVISALGAPLMVYLAWRYL